MEIAQTKMSTMDEKFELENAAAGLPESTYLDKSGRPADAVLGKKLGLENRKSRQRLVTSIRKRQKKNELTFVEGKHVLVNAYAKPSHRRYSFVWHCSEVLD